MDRPVTTVLIDSEHNRWVLGDPPFVYKLVTRTENAVRNLLDLDDEGDC